jgi:hypothetical protein
MALEKVKWTFYGYVTPAGGRDVQEWFDGLPEEAQDEARDALAYLQQLALDQWGRPTFAPLGDGIGEVRFKVNVEHEKRTYRIYGTFWPEGKQHSFTFLVGKDKKVKNDMRGKKEAVKRLKKLRLPRDQGGSTIHEFEFEKESDRAPAEREGGPLPVH